MYSNVVSATAELSRLLMQRADGNPFLLGELLEALYRDGFLRVDLERGRWIWDLDQIRAYGLTEHTADLLAGKIRRLERESQEILKVASCLGSRFDLETLGLIQGRPREQITPSLETAAAAGLLIQDSAGSGDLASLAAPEGCRTAYRFTHDKVRQAAYSLHSAQERLALHYRIGKKLFETGPKEGERGEQAFEIATHWNLCKELLTAQSERKVLTRLNLSAGKRAKDSAAFQASLELLTNGLLLFDPSWWDEEHALGMELTIEAAEAAYLSGQYERMGQYLEAALRRGVSLEDRIRALDIQIHADANRNRNQEAIRTGLSLLADLDVHIPPRVKRIHLLLALLRIRWSLIGQKVDQLIDHPTLTSFSGLSVMRLFVALGVPAYLVDLDLYGYLVLQGVQFSLRHGNSPFAAVAYTGYGVLMCGVVQDVDTGYRYGQLARRLLDKFQEKRQRGFVLFVSANFIDHWKRPLAETLTTLLEGHRYALDNGDLIIAAYTAAHSCYHSFFCAADLDKLAGEFDRYRGLVRRIGKPDTFQTMIIFEQALLNLREPGADPTQLRGAAYDEGEALAEHRRLKDRVNIFNVYATKLVLCCLFQDYQKAQDYADQARSHLDAVIGSYTYAVYHFYDSLAQLGFCLRVSALSKRKVMKRVRANQRRLSRWAAHAPANHLHKLLLVEAERLQLLGRPEKAAALYDRVIRLTREHLMPGDEALALELTACFYQARGKLHVARAYALEARYAYLRWNARAKVLDLERKFAYFFTE